MLVEEAVALERASGDRAGIARSLSILGLVALAQHGYARAAALYEEGVTLARETGDAVALNFSLITGALAYLGQGDSESAKALCEEGFELSRRLKAVHPIVVYLRISALLAGANEQALRVARLWEAAESLSESIGAHLTPAERSHYEPHIVAARARTGETAWESACAEGRAMTPEQAIEYAFSEEEPAPAPSATTSETPASSSYPAGLSAREAEVLQLVARGLTNAQVAEELFISPRTVNRHLGSVYQKLGVSSRAAATRFAIEHGLP